MTNDHQRVVALLDAIDSGLATAGAADEELIDDVVAGPRENTSIVKLQDGTNWLVTISRWAGTA